MNKQRNRRKPQSYVRIDKRVIKVLFAILGVLVWTTAADAAGNYPSPATAGKLAAEMFNQFQAEKIDKGNLSSTVIGELPQQTIHREAVILRRLGRVVSVQYVGTTNLGTNVESFEFVVYCDHGYSQEFLAFDGTGKIVGIDFHPFIEKTH